MQWKIEDTGTYRNRYRKCVALKNLECCLACLDSIMFLWVWGCLLHEGGIVSSPSINPTFRDFFKRWWAPIRLPGRADLRTLKLRVEGCMIRVQEHIARSLIPLLDGSSYRWELGLHNERTLGYRLTKSPVTLSQSVTVRFFSVLGSVSWSQSQKVHSHLVYLQCIGALLECACLDLWREHNPLSLTTLQISTQRFTILSSFFFFLFFIDKVMLLKNLLSVITLQKICVAMK